MICTVNFGTFCTCWRCAGPLGESDWLVAMRRFFSRLKVLAYENPGDQPGRKDTFSTGQIFAKG